MKRDCFSQKVAIVTGASSGIGLACARALAARGACVVLAARRADLLQQIADELAPTPVLVVPTDVSVETDCKNLIEQTVKHFGRIDILINNAGLSMRACFVNLDLSVMKRLMDVNFWGSVYCTKYALPYLLKEKGTVVGVTSIAGFVGLPCRTGYTSSKYALVGFLDTIRNEHMYQNLHVMTFAPGYTASNVRYAALTADGTPQGATPRKEEKMVSADKVAARMMHGIRKRRKLMITTPLGKLTVAVCRILPRLVATIEYRMMSNEPDSPLPPVL